MKRFFRISGAEVLGRAGSAVSGASLAVFRIGFGSIMVWEVWRYFHYGWITRYFTGLPYYFTYPGFSWVHPFPEPFIQWHFVLIAALAACITAGFLYRAATPLFFLAFSYVFLLDQARYLNHFYMVILVSFLLCVVPAHRMWSLDALLGRRFPGWFFGVPADTGIRNAVPLWSVWLLRLQIGIVYFYGGIAKITPDWLRGEPLSDWITGADHLPLIGPFMHERWMGLFLSYAGLAVDLGIVPLLLFRRTRALGFLIAVAFNVMNAHLFSIGIFPWMMIAATTVFFEPGWPLRFMRGTQSVVQGSFPVRRPLVIFLALYTAFQLLFPFRHLLYPGTVHWTEEGHNFSWHMKLRSKGGNVTFRVVDPRTGSVTVVEPLEILPERQVDKMEGRPEMIRQFTHFLHGLWRDNGHGEVEVYADAFASLNGRPRQRFIDPAVNLAAVRWSLLPARWILPLE